MTVAAYILIAIGGLFSLLNWIWLFISIREKRFVSVVPLVGAVPLAYGMALLPGVRHLAWLAIFADYGTLVLIAALPRLTFGEWTTSSFNCLHQFTSSADGRAVSIRLFRRGKAVIRVEFDPPIPSDDRGGLAVSFGLVGTWTEVDDAVSIAGYAEGRQLEVVKANDGYVSVEQNTPTAANDRYMSLDHIALQKRM